MFALNKLKKSAPIKSLCDIYCLPEHIRNGFFERICDEFFTVSAVQLLNVVGYLPKDRKSEQNKQTITQLNPPDIYYLVGQACPQKVGKDAVKDIYLRGIFNKSERHKIKELVHPFCGDEFIKIYKNKDYLDYKSNNNLIDAMYEGMYKKKSPPKPMKLQNDEIDFMAQLYNSEKSYFNFFTTRFYNFLMRKVVGKNRQNLP